MSHDLVLLAAGATHVSGGEKWTFYPLAVVSLIGAIGMVWARNAIHSALFLVATMLSLGVFYVLQAGPFLGVVQIIVYTGAIMMLFLFVLMLVGRDASDSIIETLRGQRVAAVLLGAGLAVLLGTALGRAINRPSVNLTAANTAHSTQGSGNGNVQGIAQLLFTRYVFAFEITSALLITAALGAMVLAHRQRDKDVDRSQPAMVRARFAPGNYPAPKPGPGVFATSDSVATAARLPDGSPAGRSISEILPARELTNEEAEPKRTLTGGTSS
ncbi:MAG TPA: NADH-quinone oxidoreductase subunit J [Micromonosporaceae bacterium]|jgi:NADH-quinone oxidoreductase subunit J